MPITIAEDLPETIVLPRAEYYRLYEQWTVTRRVMSAPPFENFVRGALGADPPRYLVTK